LIAALFLSTSHRSRILFPPLARFKQKERNRQQQDDREQHAGGRIVSTARHASFSVSYRKYKSISVLVDVNRSRKKRCGGPLMVSRVTEAGAAIIEQNGKD
jgi:hypothetical protein